ncbi:TPA: protein-L-isoaspartate(D-aspartate) O-methyltransferase [Salmonella enterica subsp. enterica serovar Typhi]|nr:protein-L-isoaspartate(D-aspartate) O-methyltransferase [Salmonella enterica subsp. enterica serovar Typhi]
MVSGRVQALLEQLRAQGIRDELVLNALAAVPREKFIDEAFEHKAWENIALPIGQGQTISQPYMVARMTELLELTPQSRVLEIGTGSGYQTAILAHLVHHVCSVERIKGLQWQARRRLKQLDLHNVSTRHEGGNKGIDIAGSKGQAIVATADGRVVYAGNALRGYGNLIIIKHNDDYLSAYAHNDTMLVREQQEVKAGQKIATMGSTGTSSTRLHFEIRYKGKSVNPLRYLPQR